MKTKLTNCMLALLMMGALTNSAFSQAANYPDGSTVDDFELTDVNGITYTLDEITSNGQWVLIEFFATPAVVCQDYSPLVNEFYDEHGCNAGDVFVVSVSGLDTDGNAEVESYDESYGGTFNHSPLIPGTEGANTTGLDLREQFGVAGVPTFCLISPDKTMVENDAFPIFGTADDFGLYFYIGESPADMPCSIGIEEDELITDFSTYPNPANSALNIAYSTEITGPVTFEVINLLGEVLMQEEIVQANGMSLHTLDVSSLQSGQYIIRMTANNTSKVTQFQKF